MGERIGEIDGEREQSFGEIKSDRAAGKKEDLRESLWFDPTALSAISCRALHHSTAHLLKTPPLCSLALSVTAHPFGPYLAAGFLQCGLNVFFI